MCTSANSEDPDVKVYYAAFHQGLHCELRLNQSSDKEMQYFFEIITCDRSIYGPRREKTCLRGFANNTGADQPAHPHSLISACVIHFLQSIVSRLDTSGISIF